MISIFHYHELCDHGKLMVSRLIDLFPEIKNVSAAEPSPNCSADITKTNVKLFFERSTLADRIHKIELEMLRLGFIRDTELPQPKTPWTDRIVYRIDHNRLSEQSIVQSTDQQTTVQGLPFAVMTEDFVNMIVMTLASYRMENIVFYESESGFWRFGSERVEDPGLLYDYQTKIHHYCTENKHVVMIEFVMSCPFLDDCSPSAGSSEQIRDIFATWCGSTVSSSFRMESSPNSNERLPFSFSVFHEQEFNEQMFNEWHIPPCFVAIKVSFVLGKAVSEEVTAYSSI